MYNQELHLHFVGIGGVGMAGIAEVLLNLGYSVSGSDLKRNALIDHLESSGASIIIGHSPENVPSPTRVVVISSAVCADNPEVVCARERNIPVIPRAEMLAELMRMKYGIAIAGSHGKTTTTSMTARIFEAAGLDPTVIIGGRERNKVSGAFIGGGQYLVAEADESDGSFCLLKPAIAAITNIDREHLSHYGSFSALEEAFASFMNAVPFYGLVVACFDDPVVSHLAKACKRRVVSFGLSPENDIRASDISVYGLGSRFTLSVGETKYPDVHIPLPGKHMVSNSLAAIAIALEVGIFAEEAIAALQSFSGVARRTEIVVEAGGITVIDDYAHHPSEISSTVAAVRWAWIDNPERKFEGRVIAVFQPHRYSRTKDLFGEFLEVFSEADEVVISEIYSAGEKEIPGISGKNLACSVQHPNVRYSPDLDEFLPELIEELREGDVVLMLGAGSVGQTARRLGAMLKERFQ